MIDYYDKSQLEDAIKQKKRVLIGYFTVLFLYVLISVALFLWYRTLPYKSPTISTVKWIHYPISVVMVIFSFVYLGIKFKRINRYCRLMNNLETGIRETFTGSFFEYDNTLQDKDGVDMKSLVFIEWNKYKKDFFERKVLVFDEREFPEFQEGQNAKYVTQGNVLISYEILS